jgi:hypothetical protein
MMRFWREYAVLWRARRHVTFALAGVVVSWGCVWPPAHAVAGTAACPPTGPERGVFEFPAGSASMMVEGTAVSAVVCRYAGGSHGGQDRHLVAAGVMSGDSLGQLVTNLNAVGPNIVPGRMSCPYDDGQRDLLIIDRADDEPAYVIVDLLGCSIAWNGTLRSMLRGTPDSPGEQVRTALSAVVGPPAPPNS